MGIEKATKYLQNIEAKLTLLQGSEQFERHDNMNDSVVEKIEKKVEQRTKAMNKRDDITDSLYARLRSNRGQHAKLYVQP